MKKFTSYLFIAVIASVVSCRGKEWDTEDELIRITKSWTYGYVEYPLDDIIAEKDSLTDGNGSEFIITSTLKDSLHREYYHKSGCEDGDSVDVLSTLVQIGYSTFLTIDGYRYSKKFYAHLYTMDPGIVDYEGIFCIDFYEMGKTVPWAWGKVTYSKADKYKYPPYIRKTEVGRY